MKISSIVFSILGLIVWSSQGLAFSESFQTKMTETQAKVLIKNKPLTPSEVREMWDLYDKEIIELLNATTSPLELNEKGKPVNLVYVDKKKGEIEQIELGRVGGQFQKLNTGGTTWMVTLINDLAGQPMNTFHVYERKGGKFERVAAFEDVKGPWNRDHISATTFQVQILGEVPKGKFTTLHMPPSHRGVKPNRSQIVWDFSDGKLQPTFWVPEVDWHTENGQVVPGRGLGVPVE